MNDDQKSKDELIKELADLRQQVITLESLTTEQQQTIAKLKKIEERYQLLFNNSDMGIVYFDVHCNYVMMNESIAKSLGGQPKDFIGKSIHEVLPNDAELYAERCATVIAERQGIVFEDSYSLPDGKVWYSSYLEPIIDDTGNAIGVQAIARNITERKRMEEQLRYQSTLIETVNDAIISTDMDFIVRSWNPGAEALYGRTAEEAIGKPIDFVRVIYPNVTRDEVLAEFATSGKWSGEVIHHHKDGIPIYLWGNVTTLYDDNGVPIGAVSVNRDISQRKQAEDALQRSQENMAKAQPIAHLGSWTTDLLKNDTYWSDEMYRIYGVEKENISENEIVRELVHPDDIKIFDTALNSALSGDVPEFVEYRIIRPDGEVRLLHATAQVFFDESGHVIRMIGTSQDITERRQVEERLSESNQRFAQIAEAIEHVFWLIDISDPYNYKTLYVNSAFERIWHHSVEELYQDSSMIYNYVHKDDEHLVIEAFTNFVAGNGDYDVEFRLVPPGRPMLTLAATATRITNEKGDIIRIAGITRDITKQKELEMVALENERLKTQFQKEQEQNKLIQRIISTLSHDMRTPLSVIMLSRDMLNLYFDRQSVERRTEILDTIQNQTEFALQLLEDTVLIARGQHGFNPREINIATLCQVSIDEVNLGKNTQHTLLFENPNKVEIVAVDETLVSRILLNLLSNAIKYSPDGGVIKLHLDSYPDGIVLCVSDQGMGISSDDLPHIFDLLYRSDNVNDIQGTGLGLNIVKDCVDRHQGHIRVESKLGVGSLFTVKLPV